MLILQTKFEF